MQDFTTSYFDLELAFNDKKQLVRSWMFVPGIRTADYSKPEATCVHLAEYLIAVGFGHTCGFCNDIDDR